MCSQIHRGECSEAGLLDKSLSLAATLCVTRVIVKTQVTLSCATHVRLGCPTNPLLNDERKVYKCKENYFIKCWKHFRECEVTLSSLSLTLSLATVAPQSFFKEILHFLIAQHFLSTDLYYCDSITVKMWLVSLTVKTFHSSFLLNVNSQDK